MPQSITIFMEIFDIVEVGDLKLLLKSHTYDEFGMEKNSPTAWHMELYILEAMNLYY